MDYHTHWNMPKQKVDESKCHRYFRTTLQLCNNEILLFFSFDFLIDKLDEEVIQDGVRILIDRKAQLSLLGTEMDFVENKLSSEFVFNNPNIKGTCGCGESFSL